MSRSGPHPPRPVTAVRPPAGPAALAILPVLAALAAFALVPSGLAGQTGWTGTVSLGLARQLTDEGADGPGSVGGAVAIYPPVGSGGAWGVHLGYRRFGRLDNPVPGDFREEGMLEAGVRHRRGEGARGHGAYAAVGLDLLAALERPATGNTGVDPGVAAYLGGGGTLGSDDARLRPFVEAGLHGFLATGEATGGGGLYLTVEVGVAIGR